MQGELQRGEKSWVLHARMIKTASGEIRSVADVSIDINEPDTQLLQARLAAGVGHPLALRLNALQEIGEDLPVMDAHCRFLNTTNQFVENLIACARTLSFDPWNGVALYHLSLAQLQLGRFEDALATFDQAYRFDTPAASRWTWPLGAGWACALMGRYEETLPWLQRSLAITSGSGRTHMLLAAAYQQLGRTSEARAALEKGQELRPGSTARNVPLPRENTSPVFVEASDRITQLMVAAGPPEGWAYNGRALGAAPHPACASSAGTCRFMRTRPNTAHLGNGLSPPALVLSSAAPHQLARFHPIRRDRCSVR